MNEKQIHQTKKQPIIKLIASMIRLSSTLDTEHDTGRESMNKMHSIEYIHRMIKNDRFKRKIQPLITKRW